MQHAPEFLREVADHAAQIIASGSLVDEVTAFDLGQQIAARIAFVYRGSAVTIPAGTWNGRAAFCFDLSKRDLAIYREFNGRNRGEVMQRFGISKTMLYKIIGAVRKSLKTADPNLESMR